MTSVLIELGWPAKALWPNASYVGRSHWPKTKAKEKARNEAWGATKAALGGAKFQHDGKRIAFVITAYPPTKRHADDDNVTSAVKPSRDGIAKALGVDDSYFDQRLQWGLPVKGGKIVIEIAPCRGELMQVAA
jgi:hypothetical protein